MADDKNGNPLPFCQLHQRHSAVLDLGDAPRRRCIFSVIQRLDGIDDQDVWTKLVY